MIYKRLANCNTQHDLDDMQQELIDRFGLLPEPAQTLLDSHRLRNPGAGKLRQPFRPSQLE